MGIFHIMKFIKHTFLIALFAVMCGVWCPFVAIAAGCGSSAPAGKFCKSSAHYNCRPGCYCTGGSGKDAGGYNFINACKERWNQDPNVWNDGKAAHIFLCPADFPNSNSGASKIEDCFAWWANTKINYHRIHEGCDAGYYAPAQTWQTNQCVSCANLPSNKYCPGSEKEVGGWYVHSVDYGIKDCPDGEVASDDKKTCSPAQVKNDDINCVAGTYLPNNSETCSECPDGYVCKGGHWDKAATDQGKVPVAEGCPNGIANYNRSDCKSCDAGYEPNSDHTKCTSKQIIVPAGKYLRKNTAAPTDCAVPNVNSKQYCPGGSFYVQNYDQGKYDCPFSADATSDHKACEMELTKEQLLNGVTGNGKCWLKTDPDDYKACIYGVRSN